MNRLPVVIAGTNCLSGVTTWAKHLRDALEDHPRYDVKLLHIVPEPHESVDARDINVSSVEAAQQAIRNLAPLILLPNYMWELYLAGFDPGVSCIGMCHADSDEQYYRPLGWYEPTISQFIAVSPECSERLRERLPCRSEDITTLPYGIPVPPKTSRVDDSDCLRLIYAGRVTQLQKRVWDFVPLVDYLLEAGVRFRFDVYGDGDQFEPLRDAMLARFPQDCVHFHGRVPHDAMASVWSSHDVFIQTSDFEGTSVSMLEAMAYGVLPVVTAASSGITGVIRHGENGYVSRVGDMLGMAQILARLAENRSQLAAAGVAAHRSAQAYTLEAYREQFTNVLDRVVESGEHIDMYKRYGMFGTAHPLFKQRQSIAKLESRVATLEGSALYKLKTRLFPRAHRRRMAG